MNPDYMESDQVVYMKFFIQKSNKLLWKKADLKEERNRKNPRTSVLIVRQTLSPTESLNEILIKAYP